MEPLDRAIVNSMQGGLPLCDRPYLEAARRLGIGEDELLERLQRLLDTGTLTRIGPMFQIERIGGAFTLAALHAPAADYERISALVNAHPEIAHNYERTHPLLNMWFVIATETPAGIGRTIAAIEAETGCQVFNFPKSREYFIEMKLTA
jgi:DNA-binding Lrp family transcriptional regulator